MNQQNHLNLLIQLVQVLYFVCNKIFIYSKNCSLLVFLWRKMRIDIFNNFKDKFSEASLYFANLVSVCTDGAPSMTRHISILANATKHPYNLKMNDEMTTKTT